MAQNSQVKDNSENLAKVREAMRKAQEVQLGNELETGIPIDYTSESGKQYKGTIVFRRPSTKDLMRIGAIKSEYFREAGVQDLNLIDDSVRLLAHILAHFKVIVVKSPEWFLNVDDIRDTDLIFHVYGEYKKWELSFRRDFPKLEVGDSETSEG